MFDKDNNKEGGREVEKKDYNMGCAFMFLDETKAIWMMTLACRCCGLLFSEQLALLLDEGSTLGGWC